MVRAVAVPLILEPVAEPPHSQKISNARKESAIAAKQTSPNSHAQPGGDRDDLVDTPALRGGRLVRHGGLLRRQRLGHSLAYDGKSEHRWDTTRFAEPDGPANNFGRGAQPFGPGGPMVQFGARQGQLMPFSRSPGSGYNSTPPEPYARPSATGIKPALREPKHQWASFVFLSKGGGPCARRALPSC